MNKCFVNVTKSLYDKKQISTETGDKKNLIAILALT